MSQATVELRDILPNHPDQHYPDWDVNDRAREDFETCYECQLVDPGGFYGVMSWYSSTSHLMPPAAREFIAAQFKRFRTPFDRELIEWSWAQCQYYVETVNQYEIFYGCTDVIKTEENYFYQYSVTNDNGKTWYEVPPSTCETYRQYPEGERAWEILMGYPGLKEYFDGMDCYFEDYFEEVMQDDHGECYEQEWEWIRRYGKKQAESMCHLAIWASIMWMTSPMARRWRGEHHPIFDLVNEHGAALVHEWTFYSPQFYRREERPAMTCKICGHSEWCVELTRIGENETVYICEHCLNPMPYEGMTCGKRMCMKLSCPHNPGKATATACAADERFGKLRQLPNGEKARALPGWMTLNQIAMDRYANGISDEVGRDLQKLLSF